ncbi:MAG: RNase P subunit p30 family protein [Candidatus Thorarchaeota archaeon]
MVFDLGVCSDPSNQDSFIQIALELGFNGFASHTVEAGPEQQVQSDFSILKRTDVSGRGLKSIRKKVDSVRRHSMIVSVPLSTVEIANWAAEDPRIDLLTLGQSHEQRLRDSTARLAATFGTALEVRFAPLMHLTGLNRSKVIKFYRESIQTATSSGMQVILSSGATHPLNMRSAVAIRYIGELLGMETKLAGYAINKAPLDIVERNRNRLSSDYVVEGVEILTGGSEK